MSNETATGTLGRYISDLQVADVPGQIVERLRCSLLYNLSVALAGVDAADQAQAAIRAVYRQPGRATVLGGGAALAAEDAACINAALITARGQNDTHPDINGHLGCVVIPAVLALAEERGTEVADVLAALVAGYEVPPRIAHGAVHATTARGLRGTSLYALFGAAAGCARLLRLDAERCGHALSIAANFASGLTQCYAEGTLEWSAQVAEAARSGMTAALLAEAGLNAASATLEGPRGFYLALAGAVPAQPPATSGWTLDRVTFKSFPGCAINQMPVLTLLDLVDREGIAAGQVESLVLALSAGHAGYPGIPDHGPFGSEASAIMSAPFMLQLALEQGQLHARDFATRFGQDDLHGRSRTVRVEADAALAPFECVITLSLRDGRRFRAACLPAAALVLDRERTGALCRCLADEWPTADAAAAFERLRDAVDDFFRGTAQVARLMDSTRLV